MKALKLSSQLPLLAFISLVFFAQISLASASPTDAVSGDHDAVARHYENLANDAKTRLQENRAILAEMRHILIITAVKVRIFYHTRLPIFANTKKLCKKI